MCGGILGKERTGSRPLKVRSCSGGGWTGRARFPFFVKFLFFVLFLICPIQAGCQGKNLEFIAWTMEVCTLEVIVLFPEGMF